MMCKRYEYCIDCMKCEDCEDCINCKGCYNIIKKQNLENVICKDGVYYKLVDEKYGIFDWIEFLYKKGFIKKIE